MSLPDEIYQMILHPERRLPPGEIADLDQREADIRGFVDRAVELFLEGLREDPDVSPSGWAVLLLATLEPGQLAMLAAELMFREARRQL